MKELSLRELQLFSLEILKDVHHFCVNNDIKYSMLDGSLIGTIRHKGFIPWDDDIDIIMPRPDYERFCSTYHSENYHLSSLENDSNCKIAFARVYDNQKTINCAEAPWCKDSVGVWIDVFPADGAKANIKSHQRYYTRVRNLWMLSCSARHSMEECLSSKFSIMKNMKIFFKKIVFFNGKLSSYFVKRVRKMAKSIPWGATNYWSQMTCMGDNSKEWHKMDTFASCELKDFEDTQVFVMCGYDEVLKSKYGDYMKLPPKSQQVPHGLFMNRFYWK